MQVRSHETVRTYAERYCCNRGGVSAIYPVWSDVEIGIERSFHYGGHVSLEAGLLSPTRLNALVRKESIGMDAKSSRFRIIVSPEQEPRQKTNLHEWWEPEDRPFRGTERFRDDEWDSRTVCTDISVAKEMFKDFFDNRGKCVSPSFPQF